MLRALVASSLMLATTGSLAVGDTSTAERAAPRIIVLHGGPLAQPIYLTNWWDNLTLLLAADDGPLATGTAGSEVQVAMFWGNDSWDAYAKNPARLPELMGQLSFAQRARLFLTQDGSGALLEYTAGRRAIEAEGLMILARSGLPLAAVGDSVLARGVVERFHMAWGNGDTSTLIALLAPDATIRQDGVARTRDEFAASPLRDEIVAYYRVGLRQRSPVQVTVQGASAEALSTTVVRGRDGADRPNRIDTERMTLSRRDRGWEIRSIEWTTGEDQPRAASNEERKGPEVIVMHGGPLQHPIVLANWWENMDLLGSATYAAPFTLADVERYPAIEMALFWGPGWGNVARDSALAPTLLTRLDEASKARLHLSRNDWGGFLVHGTPAAQAPDLRLGGEPARRFDPLGLAILHRRGVPLPRVSDSVLVLGTIERFHESLFRGDSAAVLDLLHPEAVILEGGAVESREEYRSGHLAADIDYLKATRTWRGPIAVTVLGSAAWARSTSTTERTVEGQVRRGVGAELIVLSKGERGWQIRAIHWSSGRAN